MKIADNMLINVAEGDIPADGHFIIPDTIKDIGRFAFANRDNLITVTLPPRITRIEEGAFYGCRNLQSVSLPKHLTTIAKNAFRYCNLGLLIIPQGTTTIGECAFWSCINLTTLIIPQGITIDPLAFDNCPMLSVIVIDAETSEALISVKNQLPIQLRNKVFSKTEYEILHQKKQDCLAYYFKVVAEKKQIKSIKAVLSPIHADSFFSVLPAELLNALTPYAIEAHPIYQNTLPELAKLEIPVSRDKQGTIDWDEYQKQFSVALTAHLNKLMPPISAQVKPVQSDILASTTQGAALSP